MIEGKLKYEFDPQEDITTYELALAMKNRFYADGFIQSEVWTKLPESVRRHFKITEVKYSNEEQSQAQPTSNPQVAGSARGFYPTPKVPAGWAILPSQPKNVGGVMIIKDPK